VGYRDNRSFVMADIPGIIEGASQGKGLGHRFLRHIERNCVPVFMIPADTDRSIEQEYQILLDELTAYNPELMDKPRLLAITKSYMLDEEFESEMAETLPMRIPAVFISYVSGKNIQKLKDMIWRAINGE